MKWKYIPKKKHLDHLLHVSAKWGICKMQDCVGCYGLSPRQRISIWYSKAQSHPLSLFSFHIDCYCLFMDTAGSLHMCHYEQCISSAEFASWPYFIYLPLLSTICCQQHPSHCFVADEIHTNANPSAFTSRARPCGVVSREPDRPALRVGALWLLLPRLFWEDLIHMGMIGNIKAFITDMRVGEGKCGL